MFFCKYKIYHIKKRKPIYKKHKLKLISLSILIIFSVLIFFIENNIQSIISNKFSENKSLNLSLEDIDFNLNGNFTIKNFLLSNKDNDSLVYSSKLSLDPISLTKAIGDFFPTIDPNRNLLLNLSYEEVVSESNIVNYDYEADSFTLGLSKSASFN